MDSSEQPDPSAGTSRRHALRDLGIGIGALTIGSALVPIRSLVGVAGAQDSDGASEEEAEAESGDEGLTDPDLLAFLESVELAAADAYSNAASGGRLGAAGAASIAGFGQHHREHAGAIGQLAGAQATGLSNEVLAQVLSDQLTQAADEKSVLKVLADLETSLASTHLSALASLGRPLPEGSDGPGPVQGAAAVVASILPVESSHSTLLAGALGQDIDRRLPAFEVVDNALPPDTFPAVDAEEASS